MLTLNLILENNIYLYLYLVIYNFSLIIFGWTLLLVIVTKLQTLQSLSNFSYNSFNLLILTVILFSIAGVPPFIGFFLKLFIMILLLNNNFFIFYFLFFILLFLGLYFYTQNIRFLHTSKLGYSSSPYLINEKISISYIFSSVLVLLLVILGFNYIDDLLFILVWIFF